MRFHKKVFLGEEVRLDGNEFSECTFDQTKFVYGGTDAVTFAYCKFGQVEWRFVDAAGRTLAFLSGMYTGAGEGGKRLVEDMFERIRRGPHALEGGPEG